MNARTVRLSALFLALLMMASIARAQTHILPLGDSITESNASNNSYRRALWNKLTDAGLIVDFVGTEQANYLGGPPNPGFDRDHNGHWGWRTDEILNGCSPCADDSSGAGSLTTWLSSYTPDIALVHLGTNDMIQDQTVASTITELGQVIDALQADNPDVIILIAQVIPTTNSTWNTRLSNLNTQILGLASSNVVIVDHWTGFDASTDTFDGVHPNATGEEHMATRWFDAILPHLPTLPVELTRFEATVDGTDLLLTWTTATETNNDGFEVEMRTAECGRIDCPFRLPQSDFRNARWQPVGRVKGHGTTTTPHTYAYRLPTPAPGLHQFRLKQIDFDGAEHVSPEIEVMIELAGTHHLSEAYPNPFNPRASFELVVAEDQHVTIELLNAHGQRVRLLHEGMLHTGRPARITVEAGTLPSGLYLYRATGSSFTSTRTLTLVK